MKGFKGFTLAELLIVIVILGILGGIALPRFEPQQEKARVAEAVAMLNAMRLGAKDYYLEHGEYPSVSWSADAAEWESKLGISKPSGDQFTYTMQGVEPSMAYAVRQTGNYGGKILWLAIDGTWNPENDDSYHPLGPTN